MVGLSPIDIRFWVGLKSTDWCLITINAQAATSSREPLQKAGIIGPSSDGDSNNNSISNSNSISSSNSNDNTSSNNNSSNT